MPASSGDPHAIEDELVGADEVQALPREHEVGEGEEPAAYEDGQPIDINVLEAQGRQPAPQTPAAGSTDPSRAPITVSGPDEESDEPGSVPPGETM